MTRGSAEKRTAEWLLFRKTAALGDLVDEATFMKMCGTEAKGTFRKWSRLRGVYGIEFPVPVFRPDGQKGVWIREEAEKFARAYKAKRATRKSGQ